MSMRAPTGLGNWQLSFHTEPATFGIDSTKSAYVRLPIVAHDASGSFSSPQSLLPFVEHGGHNLAPSLISQHVDRHTLYPRKDAAWHLSFEKADLSRSHPVLVQAVSHRVSEPHLRLTTAGFDSRRPTGFAWS